MSAATVKRKFAGLIEALGNSFRPSAIIQIFFDSNGDPVEVSAANPLPVDAQVNIGTVELGETSLAALETIELGATSLAALETIELGATSLAALENITVDGTIKIEAASSTVITRPASSLSNQTLLAALATRKGFIIVSEMGSGIAYIKLGATATTTDYSFPLLPGQIFNSSVLGCTYTGQVDCICDAVSGSLQITSLNA